MHHRWKVGLLLVVTASQQAGSIQLLQADMTVTYGERLIAGSHSVHRVEAGTSPGCKVKRLFTSCPQKSIHSPPGPNSGNLLPYMFRCLGGE